MVLATPDTLLRVLREELLTLNRDACWYPALPFSQLSLETHPDQATMMFTLGVGFLVTLLQNDNLIADMVQADQPD